MPRVGYSNAARLRSIEQPFFWAISKSQDATVAVDVETAARLGLLAEYRYMLSKTSRGAFAGGYWNESIRAGRRRLSGLVDATAGAAGQPLARAGARHAPALERASAALHRTSSRSATTRSCARSATSARTLDTDLRAGSARLTRSRAGVHRDLGSAASGSGRGGLLSGPDRSRRMLAPQRAPDLRADHPFRCSATVWWAGCAGRPSTSSATTASTACAATSRPSCSCPSTSGAR